MRSASVFATSKKEVRTSPTDVWKVALATRCWDVAAEGTDREQPGPTIAANSTRGRSPRRLTPPGYGAGSTRMRSTSSATERHYHELMPTEIDADQVRALVRDDGAVLIEVLPEREYEEEHLPGAINIPLKHLTEEAVAELDRSRPVILYCHDDL
jgi:hypothetical protein